MDCPVQRGGQDELAKLMLSPILGKRFGGGGPNTSAKAREQATAQTQKATELAKTAAELQDLYRRREVFMNNIVRC